MYERRKRFQIPHSVSMMTKNLQVVSFDANWQEIYVGTIRRNTFSAICPNDVPGSATIEMNLKAKKEHETCTVTAAKWCPMDKCTILVLGSQYGIKLFDWDGTTQIYDYDFSDNGIGVDDRLVTGAMTKGIAAIGANYIGVGIHTGTIILFEIVSESDSFVCKVVDSQRSHVNPITDLASTTTQHDRFRDVLVSGDEVGVINIWSLTGKDQCQLEHLQRLDSHADSAVTALTLWNRVDKGIIVAGYGSGLLRIFSVGTGDIVAEVTSHVGWITGMDLASQSGLLVTTAEDGFVRVWKLSNTGRIIQHFFSKAIADCILTGVKFLDPKGSSFALASYDSSEVQVFAM